MTLLILGLVVFLAIHSVRMFADTWRSNFISTRGATAFKGLYSIVSLLGLVLIVIGYGQTRTDPVFLWHPPLFMAHIAALLMLVAFILLAAANVPGNRIKAAVGHPMVLGVKVWAFSHLLANGRLGDVVLFGAFLVWAIGNYVSSRKRDRREGIIRQVSPGIVKDAVTVTAGILAWVIFALWVHLWLIGVSPFGA